MHNAGFTDEERNKMTELLNAGFTDTFRFLYPDKEKTYSWWSYMGHAREKNVGWRIDYFIVSKSIEKQIIEAKKATYYGIGMALVRIVKAIFGDEKSVLTVSSMFRGEYDINGVYAGIPSIIGRDGVREIVTLDITAEEEKKLKESCELLKNASEGIKI